MSIPPMREDLEALEGYHSAQVDATVRLNTNESPFSPPARFMDELVAAVRAMALNRYPDRRAEALRAAVGGAEGQDASRVFCANGSNEVLQCLLLAFGGAGRHALVFEPSYTLHTHISHITGTEVIALARGEGFRIEPAMVVDAIATHRPALVFLCSPNNPTGLAEPLEVVRAALETSEGLVVVDEAYGQFATESATQLLDGPGGERLVVVRTFSKTWGLAGVRLGYALCDPRIVEACFSVCLPYHLSSLTQAAGTAVLEYGAEMEAHIASVVAERERLYAQMRALDLEVWPSEANFILFRPRSRPAVEIWQGLLERSVLIRDCSSWRALEGCLRVTIGTPEENNRFLEVLKEIR